jgi:hypothetical protein
MVYFKSVESLICHINRFYDIKYHIILLTMISIQVLKKPGLAVRSPIDL